MVTVGEGRGDGRLVGKGVVRRGGRGWKDGILRDEGRTGEAASSKVVS